jgi:hypothetical protein
MYAWGDSELSEEEIDRIIHEVAVKIHSFGLDTIAIIALESAKPLSNIGAELSRMFFTPFLPILGPNINMLGDKLVYVFQDRSNLERVIKLLEEMTKEDEEKEKAKKAEKKAKEKPQQDSDEKKTAQ